MSNTPPKHVHPKVLFINLESAASDALTAKGFNVKRGFYGRRYVTPTDRRQTILTWYSLPNFTEQEIVAVDLRAHSDLLSHQTMAQHAEATAYSGSGIIDSAPIEMVRRQRDADRILEHGGTFVVFACPRISCGYFYGGGPAHLDNWSLLSWNSEHLSASTLQVVTDSGTEITAEPFGALGRLLARHLRAASFACTFKIPTYVTNYRSLAKSKFGHSVAGLVSNKKHGLVLLLPQLEDKAGFLTELIADVLPELSPHLYESSDAKKWVTGNPYELDAVIDLRAAIAVVRQTADAEIAGLERDIAAVRDKSGYLHDLLTQQGAPLVAAVKKTLEGLGFSKIVDVDADSPGPASTADLREDLRIEDQSPVVLVEVKGIGGVPSDEASLQAWKYVAPRMKEWQRIDVRALSIINHERHKPALDRENTMPFRQVILDNAKQHDFGLLTTWDLFRLARGFQKNGWKPEWVSPLFHRTGRIEPVPTHYRLVGTIERYIEEKSVLGIQTTASAFRLGDRLAYELPAGFEEESVSSIQVENKAVDEAPLHSLVGIATTLTKADARQGVRVFVVSP